jgi:hypothetical protein
MKVKLQNVRLSFPSLFNKAKFNDQETKFEATFLLHKDEQADLIAKIEAQLDAVAKEHFKGKVPKGLKLCLADGDEKEYDGYENHMSLKAASNKRPTIIDRDKTPLAEDDGVVYAGCYVNAIVDFWVQDNSWGKRINSNLLGVQFFKDGDGFGAGDTDVTNDFDAFDDFEDDDDGEF